MSKKISSDSTNNFPIINKIPDGLKKGIKSQTSGFKEFLSKNSIIPLALGVIIGQTTKQVVDSLVTGIITPLISLILQFILKDTDLQSINVKVGASELLIGQFINTFIQMLIILLIIYIVFAVIFKKSEMIGVAKADESANIKSDTSKKASNKSKNNQSSKSTKKSKK